LDATDTAFQLCDVGEQFGAIDQVQSENLL
jgi:hypothetical protein